MPGGGTVIQARIRMVGSCYHKIRHTIDHAMISYAISRDIIVCLFELMGAFIHGNSQKRRERK